jgi:hypothetical protein
VGYATPEEKAEIVESGVSSDLPAEPTLKEKKNINTEIYNALKESDEDVKKENIGKIKSKYHQYESYIDKKIFDMTNK